MQREQKKPRHVMLIYRQMIPSVRLCGHCQMEYLAQAGKIEYRAVQEMKLRCSDLNWAEIVLLGRLDSWYEYQLVRALREAGRYLIYMIDDDLLNIPAAVSSAAYYGQKEIQGYIRGMIGMSDAIASPSPLLLEKYAVDRRKAIRIEEPAISPAAYEPHEHGRPVKIGFAGSIDRVQDIQCILKDSLIQIKRTYGERVQFEFFGAIPSFAQELDARCIPYRSSYEEYRRVLQGLQWDIGLAPIPDTPFHACKHYNKFIEYAAAGIVGVFSKEEPYIRLGKQFPGVLLCENTLQAWTNAISGLIEDDEHREELRKQAVQCAQTNFSVASTADAWEKAVCIQRSVQGSCRLKHPVFLIKAENYLRRGRGYLLKRMRRLKAGEN